MRTSGKPPLARSPIRLRSRRTVLDSNTIHTPPGLLMKSKLPNGSWEVEKAGARPEYYNIPYELRALEKMMHHEFGTGNDNAFDGNCFAAQRTPSFERGSFYEEYCARRNERLHRKKGELGGHEKKTAYDLSVRVDSTKKNETRKLDNRKKMVERGVFREKLLGAAAV